MTDEESENTQQENGPETVGDILRAARERHNLDLQSVADQLHLRPSIIRAIEEGDYQSLPGELFLKGYVRSYARLTEQDADGLIARLDRELAPLRREEQEKEPSPTEIIQERKERRRRIGGALIAVVTIIVIGWVLLSYGPWVTDQTMDLIDEAATEPSEEADSGDGDAGDGGDEADEGAEADDAPEADDVPEADEETSAPDEPEADGEIASVEEDAPSEESRTSLAPISLVEAPDGNGQAENGTSASASDLEVVSLAISFSDACWVEVVNGEGERVIVTLAEAGSDVDYEGPGPLEVLLGNVDAVSDIRFQGESVDLQDYPERAGRTQFVLGGSNGTG